MIEFDGPGEGGLSLIDLHPGQMDESLYSLNPRVIWGDANGPIDGGQGLIEATDRKLQFGQPGQDLDVIGVGFGGFQKSIQCPIDIESRLLGVAQSQTGGGRIGSKLDCFLSLREGRLLPVLHHVDNGEQSQCVAVLGVD